MVPDSNSSVVPQADHLTVFFASQTGNAESISRSIHEQAQERGFKSGHYVLNDHAKVDWEKEECLVFVVSTTGDGDPPDNSTKFWRHLRKLKGTGLTKAKYAILGLGDTNYDNFCQTAKRLDTKLQELGASPFYPRGLADDATGLEETVDPWIKNIWPALAHQVVSTPTIHDLPKPHLTVEETKIVKEIIEHESQTTAPSSTPKTAATSAIVIGSYDNHPVAPPVESLSRRMDVLSVSSPTARIEPAAGNTIRIDFSSMANHSNLTALPRVPNANLIITQHETAPPAGSNPCNVPSFIQAPTPLFSAKINSVQCLTPDDALKRTLSIEFGFDDDVEYAPGDSFGIWAPNDESLVRGVLSTLGVKDEDLNKPVKLEGEGIPSHLQPIQSASLLDIFRYAVDLTTSTKKANIRLFADHATDLAEKQKLMFMSSKQGADLFNELRAQGPTLLDILHTFPSVKIPVARVIEALPPLQPRYYSITSSPMAKNGHHRWSCAFNVVQYELPVGVKRRGVCTPWLDDLSGNVSFGKPVSAGLSSIRVPMFIKPNETKFNLPVDTTKPVIMIGPGTGVAPFMGFLEHRAEQRRIKKRLVNIGSGSRQHLDDLFGEMWLFFGCRHRDRDWLFRQQMEEYRSDGVLTQLHVAVSREEDVPNSAKYVQDLIRKESKKVWDLLHRKSALIYVCGDAKGMAKSVHDELLALLIEHGGYEKMAAIMELNKWAQEKRYLRDLWA
ncbi:hypothetical protein BGZ52_000031 [Haplosporangium bisporale]|nr:hypothetical protein BGZ52_000031 [Haplosporangium bisporale]KAF9217781.1 hypothetical protein BGZ59_011223 [Podila verticillata]KFH63496.1 hypothetical protein MVEG_10905 [Podila verticillata NRRL 6337]